MAIRGIGQQRTQTPCTKSIWRPALACKPISLSCPAPRSAQKPRASNFQCQSLSTCRRSRRCVAAPWSHARMAWPQRSAFGRAALLCECAHGYDRICRTRRQNDGARRSTPAMIQARSWCRPAAGPPGRSQARRQQAQAMPRQQDHLQSPHHGRQLAEARLSAPRV